MTDSTYMLITMAPFVMSSSPNVSRRVRPGTGSRKLGTLAASDPKAHLNRSKRPPFIIVCALSEGLPSKASAGILASLAVTSFSISISIRTEPMFRPAERIDQFKYYDIARWRACYLQPMSKP